MRILMLVDEHLHCFYYLWKIKQTIMEVWLYGVRMVKNQVSETVNTRMRMMKWNHTCW